MPEPRPSALVISDDGIQRELIAATLAEAGFAVAASDGEAAVAMIAAAPVEVAVIAARLRGGRGGAEVIGRARRHHPALKALFVTDTAGACVADGADGDAVCVLAADRPSDQRRLLGCLYDLLLRDAGSQAEGRRHCAAEFGIAAARIACLQSRCAAAASAGAKALARDLARQIEAAQATLRALAALTGAAA